MSPGANERLTYHERECAERYKEIIDRIKRIEGIGLSIAGVVIMTLMSVLGTMAWQLVKLSTISTKLG